MKHAIILAHPRTESFNSAIARRSMEVLRSIGHDAILRDLYKEDFDPRLQAGELSTVDGTKPAADVVAERALLRDVDSFIFVYPFWFNGPPAILKGYIDRVFGVGFGSIRRLGGAEPLLQDRTLLTFSTSGAPDHWVQQTGALQALMQVFDMHLSGVCGVQVIGHRHIGEVVPGMTEEAGDESLTQVEDTLRGLFGRPSK